MGSRKRAIATGMIVAAADSNAASRRRPPRRPGDRLELGLGFGEAARMPSAWRTSASPASVSRTPRALRSTRTAPASRSSAAICWETADWVKESDSAAAENEPCTATSRRTRMRRTSSISSNLYQVQATFICADGSRWH